MLMPYFEQIISSTDKQKLSLRAAKNYYLVIKLGKNYLIIGIRQGKHLQITGRIFTPDSAGSAETPETPSTISNKSVSKPGGAL